MSKFQITLSEYNRIYQVMHGVLRDIGRAEKACTFFNIFGSMILNKHFKIRARPVAGGFALRVNDNNPPDVAFFGQLNGQNVATSSSGFHMWVQTKSHVIDFMAPIYLEAFADTNAKLAIPRKMFQRKLTEEVATPNDLARTGDFFTLPDPDLTKQLIDNFFDRPHSTDFLMIAETWYGGRRKDQEKGFAMHDDLGKVTQLYLPDTTAEGAW